MQEVIESSRDDQRSERDLQAQRDMARWAMWLLIATLVQIPIGIAGLIALLVTLDHGQKALAHAKTASDTQLRPYLAMSRTRITRVKGNLWKIRTTIANAGHTPAKNVVVRLGAQYVDLPLTHDPIDFFGDPIRFDFVSAVRDRKAQVPIFLSEETLVKIRAMRGCIVFRCWFSYTPFEDRPAEEVDVTTIVVGSDIDEGRPRVVPDWAYRDPPPNEEGQEQLRLEPPPDSDGERA